MAEITRAPSDLVSFDRYEQSLTSDEESKKLVKYEVKPELISKPNSIKKATSHKTIISYVRTLSQIINVTKKQQTSLSDLQRLHFSYWLYCTEMVIALRTPRGSFASQAPMPEFSGKTYHLDNDRYTYNDSMDSLIGLGSFGVVFKGHDNETDEKVAIKKMSRIHIKENELKVVKSLKSRFLVGVLNICSFDDVTCCLIMELCDGDLDYHIKYNSVDGILNASNFRLLVDNIARGYRALFDQRIVHRDIKPQNILVKYQGNNKLLSAAKITDFGIARTLDEDGESDLCNVAGTLFYMAPEVGANLLKTCQYDSKVDMWSIGCLLYQCITGEIPFDECSLCKLFLYTAGENYEAYDQPELPETTSEVVGEIIHSLLEIDSSRRCTPIEFYNRAVTWSKLIC